MTSSNLQDELHEEFSNLAQALEEIDEELKSGAMIDIATGKNFSDQCAAERQAMMDAVYTMSRFLRSQGIYCKILDQLWRDLQQVRLGSAVARLTPKPRAGRKKDSREIAYLKGRIAGMARRRMITGQSRDDAAAWVVRKMPDRLASLLSSKPIQASTVKEWMDQYDCGADVLDVFASEETRKEFESCARTEPGEDEDEEPYDLFARQLGFVRHLIPKHKRRSSPSGIMGFVVEICEEHLANGPPSNFDHLLADFDGLAAGSSPEA